MNWSCNLRYFLAHHLKRGGGFWNVVVLFFVLLIFKYHLFKIFFQRCFAVLENSLLKLVFRETELYATKKDKQNVKSVCCAPISSSRFFADFLTTCPLFITWPRPAAQQPRGFNVMIRKKIFGFPRTSSSLGSPNSCCGPSCPTFQIRIFRASCAAQALETFQTASAGLNDVLYHLNNKL